MQSTVGETHSNNKGYFNAKKDKDSPMSATKRSCKSCSISGNFDQ